MNNLLFNKLAADVAERFGLSADKMRQLLGVLTALIFDGKRGGFAGFVHLFRQKDMGYLVQSWIDEGLNGWISSSQVDSLFGLPLVDAIANKLGVHPSVASSAIGGLLPGLVNELTVGGKEPTSIPEVLRVWVAGIADWLGDFKDLGWGGLAEAAGATLAGSVRAADRAGDKTVKKAEGGELVPWLVLGGLLFITFLLFKSCKKEDVVAPAVDTVTTRESTVSVAKPTHVSVSKTSMARPWSTAKSPPRQRSREYGRRSKPPSVSAMSRVTSPSMPTPRPLPGWTS